MRFLRQNTDVIVTVGPFYDKGDGVTIETGLTITNERITLTADTDDNSAPTNILDNVTGATSGTSNDLNYITGNDAGMMQLELTAANTNRVGRALLSITDAANHVPVFHEFFIIPQAIYDWFTGVVVPLPANVTHAAGTAWGSGAITAASIATGAIDADAIADNAIDAGAIADGAITAAKIADGAIDAATFAANAITSTVLANDAITAAKLAADVTTELQSGLATAANLSTVAGYLDTEIAAILADTNELQTDLTDGGRLDLLIDAILEDTGTTLDDLVDNLEARLGTPSDLGSGATVAANLADIEAQTDDIGVAGAGLTVLATQASVNTIDDLLDTEIPALTAALNGMVLASGTIGGTGNDTTHLHLAGLAYADDAINSMLLAIKDVSTGLYYSRWIEDFANTGDLATVATLPFTPEASVDLYWILPVRADVTGGSGLDAAGVRAAVGLASANLDTQLGDLPTNAELATSQAAADDATLAAIAVLNNLSAAQVNAEVDTAIADVGLTTTITGRIDAAISTRLASASYSAPLDAAGTRSAVGLASANLDTQLDALPTNAELATSQEAADDATLAAIAALNNLSSAQVTAAVPTAAQNATAVLAAAASNPIDANVQEINDTAIVGNGVSPKFGV
jgi:hypothetical protein